MHKFTDREGSQCWDERQTIHKTRYIWLEKNAMYNMGNVLHSEVVSSSFLFLLSHLPFERRSKRKLLFNSSLPKVLYSKGWAKKTVSSLEFYLGLPREVAGTSTWAICPLPRTHVSSKLHQKRNSWDLNQTHSDMICRWPQWGPNQQAKCLREV